MWHASVRVCDVIIATLGFFCFIAASHPVQASEADALAISSNIQRLHIPYGTILDPVFASSDPNDPGYTELVSYARAADSAIWTGHYLAAEALRYHVTGSAEALENAWRALQGVRSLLDITGSDVLARCLIPEDSPYAAAIQQQEGGHGIYHTTYNGQAYFWIGNTSRDQYSGVLFGLSLAYDLIDQPGVRTFIRDVVTRILNFLLLNAWNVVMPDGRLSTTFLYRPDQLLAFLQIGRHVNPEQFEWVYSVYRAVLAGWVVLPIAFDNLDDHGSYFKFNLNYITLFSLVRLEESTSPFLPVYMNAYAALRRRTETHGNAHFNMVDRVLRGEDAARDGETVTLLEQWLQRPRRDYFTDLQGVYPACATNRSCSPIPVPDRIDTDFLWQRSPFQLAGGGAGTIETAGIDYILPYWMARLLGLPAAGV